MKIGNDDVKSFMTLNYSFPGIRIINDEMFPTTWDLDINLVATEFANDAEPGSLNTNGSIAYQKAFFWLDHALSYVVMTSIENPFGLGVATSSRNTMMYCPGEPTDDLIIQLLHAKLSAITEGNLCIGEITLGSKDSTASYTYNKAKAGYTLPAKVKDYVDLPSLHRKPWWHRSDGFAFEFLKKKDNKAKIADLYKDIQDPLLDFEQMIQGSTEEVAHNNEPAEIIHIDKWKPKKV